MKTILTAAPNDANTYFFKGEVAQEEDGRWSAWIEALPGCAAWGYTREEALQAINDAATLCIEDMLEYKSSNTLPLGTLRSVIQGARWTEADWRRLKLIR